jgi:DnaJ-domain-containing protein 1
MTQSDARLPEVFYTAIEQELEAHLAGMSEHELIKALKGRGFFDFLPPPPADPHHLFRAHFLLFHALYQLRDRLSSMELGLLQIGALCIRCHPWTAGENILSVPDSLRAFYLDWSNLDGTTEDDVCKLIASFWNQLGRFDNRESALAELGLEDPVDDKTIKLAWRRLAMEHHPDRGGDNERLQAINAAVDCLMNQA